jgi:hypothetical protein
MILKISRAKNLDAQGHVLVMVLVVVTICAFALMSYLTLVNSQNRAVARSQGWNATVPVMEAGVEEALAHLNANTVTNLGCDGWVKVANYYRMERTVGDNYYVVTITATNPIFPVIESRGFSRTPLLVQYSSSPYFFAQVGPTYGSPQRGYTGRGVRVDARKNGSLVKAMLSKGRINLGGTVRVDSYRSCDGPYDPATSDDCGDVASNGELNRQVSVGGDVQIRGHISTGPGGTVGISGTEVSIGSKAWVEGGNSGIEPGWFRDDMNVTVADSPTPPAGGYTAFPGGGYVDGVWYDWIVPAGTYSLTSVQLNGQKKLLITGDVILKVNGDVQTTDESGIVIGPTGSLQMFVTGSASMGGSGVSNMAKDPWRFSYWGMKSNTRVTFNGSSEFYGLLYAPYADLTLGGGSVIYGGIVSKTVNGTGGFTLHYDKCLSQESRARYIVINWDEMTPQEVARVP